MTDAHPDKTNSPGKSGENAKPSLADLHWRACLRAKPPQDILAELQETMAAGNQWRFDILVTLPRDPEWLEDLLTVATEHDRIDMFRRLAADSPDWSDNVDIEDLAYAAGLHGALSILKMLIEEHGVNADAYNDRILIAACKNGQLDVLEYFLSRDPDMDFWPATVLSGAAEGGHVAVVKRLLDAGIDAAASGGIALGAAAREGHTEIIKLLLATLPAGCRDGLDDALQRAAEAGHLAAAKLLAESGADINADDGQALADALEKKELKTAAFLLGLGADANAGNGILLRSAVDSGEREQAELLLQHGANPNLYCDGATPLALAAENGDLDMLRLLNEHGAHDHLVGHLARSAAVDAEKTEAVDLLDSFERARRHVLETEKRAEFHRAFPAGYTLDNLRHQRGPSGQTGLLIAAQTGVFADLLRAEKGGGRGLAAEDLFHPDDGIDCVLSALTLHGGLRQFFAPDFWVDRPAALLDAANALPQGVLPQADIEAIVAESNHRALQKGPRLPPPKPSGPAP